MYLYKDEPRQKSKTALILCVYVRLENFSKTLTMVKEQKNKDFDFYICDNSEKQPNILNSIKKNFYNTGINIYVKSYFNKFKIFSRHILAKELALEGYEKIIFIDDDEKFSTDFIDDCYNQYEEDSVKSFYAHRIECIYSEKVKLKVNQLGNYAGGGGLVCSSKVFLSEELINCPEEYWILDDLWLSYCLLKFTNYKIKTLDTDIRFMRDQKATFLMLGNMKQQFSDEFILPEYGPKYFNDKI